MTRPRLHVITDLVWVALSVCTAIVLARFGVFHSLAILLQHIDLLGILVAGVFFTSVFTTAPAIVILAELAQHNNIWIVACMGGIGAMVGDYFIFRFVRDRVGEDVEYLLSHSHWHRVPAFFRTRLFHRFVPMVGALIIISPLPDELGLAMLGLSHISTKRFFLVSFLLNAAGIFFIGVFARMSAGQALFW